MSTIGETLIDIEELQKEIERSRCFKEDTFTKNLFSFTTCYYFGLLSHVCLENDLQLPHQQSKCKQKYYSLFRKEDVLKEYIRWINIGGIFSLWSMFEVFISQKVKHGKWEERYKKILKNKNVKGSQYNNMLEEFNCIRLTRNSLHQGGIYQGRNKTYKFQGKECVFKKGKSVVPLRIIEAAKVLWKHYEIINGG